MKNYQGEGINIIGKIMIQAASFILPIAEALGLSVTTLGMAKVTDEVNKYIRENPKQAQKLITAIMPVQGIASMFEGKDDDNLPKKTNEKKPPQEEPPKDSNLLPEIISEILNKKLEDKAEYKFQYMANKEGGQTLGNREIIVNLDEDLFNKYLKDKTTFKNFKEYEEKNPNNSIKLFKRADQKEYQVTDVGQIGEDISFTPEMQDNPYRIQVKNFNSKKAIKQAKTFDSDVFSSKADGGLVELLKL